VFEMDGLMLGTGVWAGSYICQGYHRMKLYLTHVKHIEKRMHAFAGVVWFAHTVCIEDG
jgi:hypothetical protein